MAPPELESSADDYLSSHDESSELKLLFVQPRSFRGSRKRGFPQPAPQN